MGGIKTKELLVLDFIMYLDILNLKEEEYELNKI